MNPVLRAVLSQLSEEAIAAAITYYEPGRAMPFEEALERLTASKCMRDAAIGACSTYPTEPTRAVEHLWAEALSYNQQADNPATPGEFRGASAELARAATRAADRIELALAQAEDTSDGEQDTCPIAHSHAGA